MDRRPLAALPAAAQSKDLRRLSREFRNDRQYQARWDGSGTLTIGSSTKGTWSCRHLNGILNATNVVGADMQRITEPPQSWNKTRRLAGALPRRILLRRSDCQSYSGAAFQMQE